MLRLVACPKALVASLVVDTTLPAKEEARADAVERRSMATVRQGILATGSEEVLCLPPPAARLALAPDAVTVLHPVANDLSSAVLHHHGAKEHRATDRGPPALLLSSAHRPLPRWTTNGALA